MAVRNDSLSEKKTRKICLVAIAVFVLVYVVFFGVHVVLDLPFERISYICKSIFDVDTQPLTKVGLSGAIVLSIISAAFDIKIVKALRSSVSPSGLSGYFCMFR